MPDALEQRLRSVGAEELPSRLVILGDFLSIPPERSSASYEAIRLLAEAADFHGAISVCWLDGEAINLSRTCSPDLVWYKFLFDVQRRSPHAWQDVLPTLEAERIACHEIGRLIGRFPGFWLSEEGRVEGLNLTDGEPYRRSLVAALTDDEKHSLWRLILRLTGLRELRAGFSELRELPDLSALQHLDILDLRGNPQIRLEELAKVSSLKKLNLAACELDRVPSGVECLTRLHTLMLHKNSIREVSSIVFPRQLQRLSLYRNQITSGRLDISHCENISEVNLGANPLVSLTLHCAETACGVSLGVRHVMEAAKKVRWIW
jgi:Leucine-rich repeat (LRR) protein